MKLREITESIDKRSIIDTLNSCGIQKSMYHIEEDGSITIKSPKVKVTSHNALTGVSPTTPPWRPKIDKFEKFPVKINNTNVFIDLHGLELQTLENFPSIVGDCNLFENNLQSLDHAPKIVKGTFAVGANPLTSLKNSPREVEGSFSFGDSYFPSGHKSNIHSWDGCPEIMGSCHIKGTLIDNFEGIGKIKKQMKISYGKFSHFKNIHKHLRFVEPDGEIEIDNMHNLKSHILGLTLVENLSHVDSTLNKNQQLDKAISIINKYLGKGTKGMLAAHRELIDENLDDYAQL